MRLGLPKQIQRFNVIPITIPTRFLWPQRLPCKHMDLSLTSGTHIKKAKGMEPAHLDPSTGEVEPADL